MKLEQLIEGIGLQKDVAEQVLERAKELDIEKFRPLLEDIDNRFFYETEETRKRIKEMLEPDPDNLRILALQLMWAALKHKKFKELNISDEIYFETFACFTRFLNERYEMSSKYYFDRADWTYHQIGFYLFRIGCLEYEKRLVDGEYLIAIHIPSDAVMTKENLESSLKEARRFFDERFPLYKGAPIRCITWLLSPELKKLLKEGSKILQFADCFDITEVYEYPNMDWYKWVFLVDEKEFSEDLPEKTSLQRALKNFIREGGEIHAACGYIKKELIEN